MARFAQYYLKYLCDNLFAHLEWADRQRLLGALLENEESIRFGDAMPDEENESETEAEVTKETDSPETKKKPKTYKHRIHHLTIAPDIIVMRIANVKEMVIEKDFHPETVEHNPSCFVIFDNRGGCRRVAIQKLATSFSSTDQVMKIIQKALNERMMTEHHIGVSMSAQRYTMDFYRLWRAQQHHTQRIRFNISSNESVPSSDLMEDSSIVHHIMELEKASLEGGYRSAIELESKEKGGVLFVDETSTYIKNLVRYSASTATPIELITSDGASFECFIDSDLESDDKVVTVELETEYLDCLFGNDEEAMKAAEEKVLEFVNGMKHVVDDKEEEVK